MQAILYDKIHIAEAVNVQLISLDEAPVGYKDFDKGVAKKFVLDPHGTFGKWSEDDEVFVQRDPLLNLMQKNVFIQILCLHLSNKLHILIININCIVNVTGYTDKQKTRFVTNIKGYNNSRLGR